MNDIINETVDDSQGWETVGGGERAEEWKYKEAKGADKTVTGVYVEKRTNLGKYNSTLHVLRKADDSLVGVWGSTALENKFDTTQIGNEVRIEYLGMVKSKDGNDYHDFKFEKRQTSVPGADVNQDDTDDIFDKLPE